MKRLNNEEFIKRARTIHGTTYGYSYVDYKGVRKKVKILCQIHGIFEQNHELHIVRKCGCPKCGAINGGKNHKMTTKSFLQKIKRIHPTYTYPDLKLVNGLHSIINVSCPKHGNFSVRASSHLHDQHGCMSCFRESRRLTTEEFILKSKKIFGEYYDYTNTTYITNKEKIKLTCPEHGQFLIKPCDHYRLGCFKCKKNRYEDLWMNEHDIPNDGEHRQVPITLNKKNIVVDGFLKETNTVYLFHGDYWHGNPTIYKRQDINKTNQKTFGELYDETIQYEENLKEHGYHVISIWESDWLQNENVAINKI